MALVIPMLPPILKDGNILSRIRAPNITILEPWGKMSLSDFKVMIDVYDQEEDMKALIGFRQMLKKNHSIKWRKAKLRWVIKLIKSLETTTKSRGGRLLRDMNMEEI